MPPPPSSRRPDQQAWQQPRPNQQAIAARLAVVDTQPTAQRLYALGCRIRRAFTTLPLPLLAVQSDFSRLEGTASPAHWGLCLGALHDAALPPPLATRGGNHPAGAAAVYNTADALNRVRAGLIAPRATSEPTTANDSVWAVLADRDDCCGVPAALSAWGDRHLGLGATIALPGGDVVLVAADETARRNLCRLLSARHDGNDGNASYAGLIALVRNADDGAMLRQRGAEVYWRADLHPETHRVPFPIVCVPLLRHLDEHDRTSAALRDAIRRGSTVDPHFSAGSAAVDLLQLPPRFAGYEAQLEASAALRTRLGWQPTTGWILPPLVGDLRDCDPDLELRRLAEAGLRQRYVPTIPDAARARLEHELDVIRRKRFASYLLSVWSLTRGRTTCGRGSGASSIVCYLLAITNVDPIAARLRFERFLSPERTDPPDLDVDFPWDERDAVFAEVFRRYGADHAGMVATHQCLGRDGARREAAKAYGLPGAGGETDDPRWRQIVAAAETLIGAPRHLGLHCGGIVITDRPLREIVPVHRAAKIIAEHADTAHGVPAIAWEKDGAERLGLVKIDLLGNRSLAVIRDALADLRADGVVIDPATWDPTTDAATAQIIAAGQTLGCFYIESPATRLLQAKVGSGDFDRLVVHSSMIRPAGSLFIDAYITRHHRVVANHGVIPPGCAEEWFPHPCLRNLLSDTYGVFAYQEDVMGSVELLAGFTAKESNGLRKALGRSNADDQLEQIAIRFDAGCRERGVSDAVAEQVWRMIASFAGYSFCKAHSASYAMVSFQCAWLKAHYPAHFLARVIANEGGFYAPWAYVEEARRLGVRILAPCVHASVWATQREAQTQRDVTTHGHGAAKNGAIRLGFHLVRGLSRTAVASLIHARPFTGVNDVMARTSCTSEDVIALREAGAFDVLTPQLDEAQRSWLVARCLRSPPRHRRDDKDRIDFGVTTADPDPRPPRLPALARTSAAMLRLERLGVLVDCHFLALHPLSRRPRWRARDVTAVNAGRHITLIAMVITAKTVHARSPSDTETHDGTQHFRDMAFVTLEDETGLVEATWFPDAWAAHGHVLAASAPLRVEGRVEVSFGVATLTVQRVSQVPKPPPR